MLALRLVLAVEETDRFQLGKLTNRREIWNIIAEKIAMYVDSTAFIPFGSVRILRPPKFLDASLQAVKGI